MGKLALAVIALSSAAAHADPCDRVDGFEHCTIDGDEETREVAPRIRWEGEAAWRIGVTSFDGNAAFTTGAVGALGIARGRLALYADLGDSYVSAPDGATATTLGRGAGQAMASDGGLRRIGGRVRYSFARWLSMSGDDDIGEGAVYAMLGAGHQRVDWGGGGRLDRNDVVLGIGGLLGEQLSHRHHVDRHLAFYFDVLMTYTRHREPIGPPTCAGPCDVPTSPSSIDASVTVDMGVLFGG